VENVSRVTSINHIVYRLSEMRALCFYVISGVTTCTWDSCDRRRRPTGWMTLVLRKQRNCRNEKTNGWTLYDGQPVIHISTRQHSVYITAYTTEATRSNENVHQQRSSLYHTLHFVRPSVNHDLCVSCVSRLFTSSLANNQPEVNLCPIMPVKEYEKKRSNTRWHETDVFKGHDTRTNNNNNDRRIQYQLTNNVGLYVCMYVYSFKTVDKLQHRQYRQ